MYAFVVLLLAALSRFLPFVMPHGVGLNINAVGAGLLLFGSRRPRWQALVAMAVMALTDVVLTVAFYHSSFHVGGYLIKWAWWGALCLISSGLLRKVTVLRVIAGIFTSAIGFFVVVDFGLWAFSSMYPHTLAGLGACYAAAVPFLWNDLASTAAFSAAFFGLPVLAEKLVQMMHHARSRQPLG